MKLISTEYYSLSQLFGTSYRKIIIPDFQRDYCWGDEIRVKNQNIVIVTDFIKTIIDEHKNGKTFLGKIDVYQNPADHIYLTDGQQRLTTLYLLIGMLLKNIPKGELKKKKELKNCLISNYEENKDDKEPYLQYAIRETSIFFLRDLVNEYFIKENELDIIDIRNQPWFFNEYNLDPTIISMIKALEIIEDLLNKNSLDFNEFSSFVINDLKIQYYDVVNRELGEERFVILNTTGEELTVSENIKPILLGKVTVENYSTQWEERETWFWKYRNKEKEHKELIADDGVNDFLAWCFQIVEQKEIIDLIKISKDLFKKGEGRIIERLIKINVYFESLKSLIQLLNNTLIQNQFLFINENREIKGIIDLRELTLLRQQNILLPVLAFISKISKNENDVYQFIRRLRKNYFDKIWPERNDNHIDWRYILQIIERSKTLGECLSFEFDFDKIINLDLPNGKWFNHEERLKTELKKVYRNEIEHWEDHLDFMGDLGPLFNATANSSEINEVRKYFISYCDFLSSEGEVKNEISLIRICSDFYPHWFNADDGFRCIVKNLDYKIFNKTWFIKIWHIFTENPEKRIESLKKVNKVILSFIIERKCFEDNEEFNNLDFLKEVSITIEKIKEFEKERVQNWGWMEGYPIALVYYWMHMEKLFDCFQDLSIEEPLNQIGFRILNENEEDESLKYTFTNLKIGTHVAYGKSLNFSFKLMEKVNALQEERKNQEIERAFDKLRQALL